MIKKIGDLLIVSTVTAVGLLTALRRVLELPY